MSTPMLSTNQNLRLYCQKIMQDAGELALKNFSHHQNYSVKSDHSLLTATDKAIDQLVQSRIKKDFPQYSIFSEESDTPFNPDHPTFILDPIEGTTNFTYGVPVFGSQIALWQNHSLEAAAVFDPINHTSISAGATDGVYLNDQKVSLSVIPLEQITLLFDTGRDQSIFARFSQISLLQHFRSYRRFGSLVTDLSFLMHHHYGVYLGLKAHLYDFAPAACILKLSGYDVFDASLTPWTPHLDSSLFAMHPSHTSILLPLIKSLLVKEANHEI